MSALNIYNLTQLEWWREALSRLDWSSVQNGVRFALIVLLSIIALWFLSISMWNFFPVQRAQPDLLFVPSVQPLGKQTEGDHVQIDVAKILSWDLFGEIPIDLSAAFNNVPVDEQIAATLTGVIYSSNAKVARAIIRMDKAKNQKHYRIGAVLEGTEAIVSAINIDNVILTVNDNNQTLQLYKPKQTGKDDGSALLLNPQQIIDKRNDAKSRRAAKKYRDTLLADVTQLKQLLRFARVEKDKKTIGYRVNPRRNHKDFLALGLKNGDIITAVDEIPLDGLSNLQKVMRTLEKGGAFSFYVLRGDVVMELLIDSG